MIGQLALSPNETVDETLARRRSEAEVRAERAWGSKIDGYLFNAEYVNRHGDLESMRARGRDIEEAKSMAVSSVAGTGLQFRRICTPWSVVILEDGRSFDRKAFEAASGGEVMA